MNAGDALTSELRERIRAEVAKAPPLSRAQLDQLAVVLRPTIAEIGRDRVPARPVRCAPRKRPA